MRKHQFKKYTKHAAALIYILSSTVSLLGNSKIKCVFNAYKEEEEKGAFFPHTQEMMRGIQELEKV